MILYYNGDAHLMLYANIRQNYQSPKQSRDFNIIMAVNDTKHESRQLAVYHYCQLSAFTCHVCGVIYCPAYLSARLSLDELLVALNDDALVASTYCLACKVVCLCV